jgi:hypothetical protein
MRLQNVENELLLLEGDHFLMIDTVLAAEISEFLEAHLRQVVDGETRAILAVFGAALLAAVRALRLSRCVPLGRGRAIEAFLSPYEARRSRFAVFAAALLGALSRGRRRLRCSGRRFRGQSGIGSRSSALHADAYRGAALRALFDRDLGGGGRSVGAILAIRGFDAGIELAIFLPTLLGSGGFNGGSKREFRLIEGGAILRVLGLFNRPSFADDSHGFLHTLL